MKLLPGGDSAILGMPVDSLLLNSWNNSDFANSDIRHFMISDDTDDESCNDHKPTIIDDLDLLLTATTATTNNSSSQTGVNNNSININNINININNNNTNNNNNLAELKPLPPFTGYTGHLSINGISGHHYHSIAAAPNSNRILIETNNNTVETTNQNNVNVPPYYPTTDHVVSSSTMDNTIDSIKTESVVDYGLSSEMDDDLAAIIGSAMADTTVSSNRGNCDDDSRGSWLDWEDWIGSACGQTTNSSSSNFPGSINNKPMTTICPETLQDFVANSQFAISSSPPPTINFHHHPHMKAPGAPHHQHLGHNHTHNHGSGHHISTTFPHMPLLQNRLQNGPPKPVEPPPLPAEISYSLVNECPSPSSSTPYLAHSPPCHVVSTTDIGGFIQAHSSTRQRSPELQVSFPHTTTPSTKKCRNRSKAAKSSSIVSSLMYNNDGNMGKEKTIHRCNICNRGFLNKSNIKVHLRTHTGEKPFRCEVCGKAFRQKAHLIKHAQIHKRIGRDS